VFVSDTAVFFKEVEIKEAQSASFSGGGPFLIDTLVGEKKRYSPWEPGLIS